MQFLQTLLVTDPFFCLLANLVYVLSSCVALLHQLNVREEEGTRLQLGLIEVKQFFSGGHFVGTGDESLGLSVFELLEFVL